MAEWDVSDDDWLAARFEEHRARLSALAYRMLGSRTEAEDTVQDAWLRVSRSDATGVANLGSWLTTVVSRLCLNVLQSRRARPEVPFDLEALEPIESHDERSDPEQEALLADSVGLARRPRDGGAPRRQSPRLGASGTIVRRKARWCQAGHGQRVLGRGLESRRPATRGLHLRSERRANHRCRAHRRPREIAGTRIGLRNGPTRLAQ